MLMENIVIKGARQHNLKNVSLEIPKDKLVIFTGLSGSGKSSLAFDTIYAEGQRRYVESLSSYARQFLGVMDKPDVDTIEGLSPAISIDQKSTSHNPRSTVGTVTEIYDYLRLLYARVGHPHCPNCGREISKMSGDQIVGAILKMADEGLGSTKRTFRVLITSPVVRDHKGEFAGLFDNLKAKGYRQVRVDGKFVDLDSDIALIKTNKHTIDVVIDRISIDKPSLKEAFVSTLRSRLNDAVGPARYHRFTLQSILQLGGTLARLLINPASRHVCTRDGRLAAISYENVAWRGFPRSYGMLFKRAVWLMMPPWLLCHVDACTRQRVPASSGRWRGWPR